MFSPESKLFLPSSKTSALPGLDMHGSTQMQPNPNPFAGIRRAGQAKRAMGFEKFQHEQGPFSTGAKSQMMGGQAGSLFGSMKQNKQAY